MRTKAVLAAGMLAVAGWVEAQQFTGPAVWQVVQTNAVKRWTEAQPKGADGIYTYPGVTVDVKKREVRLLAEAVGHRAGITTEFLLVGPMSDRAYEALAVTVASPSDIVRAVERLGLARGGGIGSRPFRFWPYGEHLLLAMIRLDDPARKEQPFSAFIKDSNTETPMIGADGIVFTGGRWIGDACLTDTNMPASVCSLYNEGATVFDVPSRVGQSEVYGRLTVAEQIPYGTLLEVVLRPLLPPDGKPRMLPLTLTLSKKADAFRLAITSADGRVSEDLPLTDGVKWLKARSEEGREPFVTLDIDEALTLADAARVAELFAMLDGKGLKLDGKPDRGVYPMAFLPQEKWRERKDRIPQPFELHLTRDANGAIRKKLVFIEEDWSGESLDPALTPKEYPFDTWDAFLPLVKRTGGPDNKVNLLFVFAPGDLPLREVMPGVRAVSDVLPLVYLFKTAASEEKEK